MNWKKIGLFILFLLVGLFVFVTITIFTYISVFLPIFFVAYCVLLVLILRSYSKKKMVIISVGVIFYLLIMVIPFPICTVSGFFSSKTQDCTCIGIQKHSWMVTDASWSQCVGIPIDYVCYSLNLTTGGNIETIPCNRF